MAPSSFRLEGLKVGRFERIAQGMELAVALATPSPPSPSSGYSDHYHLQATAVFAKGPVV